MRRVLLVLVALVLVVSGVASVSAYEAHIINVTTHLENAMYVSPGPIDFGTVFPEEWFTEEFKVKYSTSFCWDNQTRVDSINYSVYVEWKLMSDNGTPDDPADDTYYPWLGDALYIGIDVADPRPEEAGGDLKWVGNVTPSGPPGALWVMDSPRPISKDTKHYNMTDWITVGLDVPVFEGYYNELTDVATKPSDLDHPTVIIAANDTDRWYPEDGVDLGVDLKFQVTSIFAQ